jgi:hypothetical protein
MKTFKFILAAFAVAFFITTASAQVVGFGSPQALTGTNTTSAVATPIIQQRVAPITLVLTNEQAAVCTGFVGTVFLSTSPTSVTNAAILGTYATNGWTGNITNNFGSYYTNTTLYIILQANVGSNNIGATEIYGP